MLDFQLRTRFPQHCLSLAPVLLAALLPLHALAGGALPALEIRTTKEGAGALSLVGQDGVARPITLLGPTASPYLSGRREDIADLDPQSCQPRHLWASADELLAATAAAGLNSVRCFAQNPWLSSEPAPFLPGRSLQAPEVNPDLISRLRHFGEAASSRGIAIQIAFFDHISIRHTAFHQKSGFARQPESPFLPWLASDAGADAQDPRALCATFFRYADPKTGQLSPVGRMQRLWIRAVVGALPQGTVIYELVNEPRHRNNPGMTREELLAWQDWAIGQVREAEKELGLPRHVIAISPDPHGPRDGAGVVLEDLKAWRELEQAGTLHHYSDVGLVVLHGQPFFGTAAQGSEAARLMNAALAPFLEEFPELTFEVSSDGLNGPQHWVRGTACEQADRSLSQLRHGFFTLEGPTRSPEQSSPYAWTRSVLELGQHLGAGRVHFNNWSPAAPAIAQMGLALRSAATIQPKE